MCLRNALDSMLAQTCTDFEIIISDNASTDSTQEICQEYLEKDKRIRYIRQESNIGIFANFEFVFKQCNSEYFMWAAADDYWLPEFLEKNIQILESDKNVVASISKVAFYSDFKNRRPNMPRLESLPKMIDNYEKNVSLCLKFMPGTALYGIYKSDVLAVSYIPDRFWAYEVAIILEVLRHGHFFVHEDILMYRYNGSRSARGRTIMMTLLQNHTSPLKTIFASYPFTMWCAKNLGLRIFLKNARVILRLNLVCSYAITWEIIRGLKRRIFGQDRLW